MRGWLRRLVGVAGVALVALGVVIVTRAVVLRPVERGSARARDLAQVDGSGAAERLAAALRFETISWDDPAEWDPAPFMAFREFLERTFPRVHGALEREVVGGHSLLYRWPGTDAPRPPILLMGHMDVVPAEEATIGEWTHPPFAGRIADGFVWGRGALDDKLGVMGILEAAEWLLERGHVPRRTLYFAFGHDEEARGIHGAAVVAELLRSRSVRLAMVLDEGTPVVEGVIEGLSVPAALVAVAEKGYLTVELTARGEGGHSSTPPRPGAVGILARAVDRLERNPVPARLDGPMRDLLTTIGPHLPFAHRVPIANLWLFEPLVLRRLAANRASDAAIRTTTAVTILDAGLKENLVPTVAQAVVNFRIRPGETVDEVLAHVRRVVDDPRVTIVPRDGAVPPSPVSPIDGGAFRRVADPIRRVFPDAVVAPALLVGATDSRYFTPLADAVYRFSPIRATLADIGRVHGIDERVSVERYSDAVRFFVEVMRSEEE